MNQRLNILFPLTAGTLLLAYALYHMATDGGEHKLSANIAPLFVGGSLLHARR